MSDLYRPITELSGIGPAKAKAFARLGIETVQDLVMFFPRTYEDRSVFKNLGDFMIGESACVTAVVSSEPQLRYAQNRRSVVRLKIADDTGTADVIFFNGAYVKNQFHRGDRFCFYGRNDGTLLQPKLINPKFERLDATGRATGRIVPVYRHTEGVTDGVVRKAMAQCLSAFGDSLPDALPDAVRRKYELPHVRFAYENIHFPEDRANLELAKRRLIFEEFFVLSAALRKMRGRRTAENGRVIKRSDICDFYRLLPFELTGAQKRAINDAIADMSQARPMNRLVQGDVGSGKTMVAAACCWYVWKAGCQCAFMAPTEILAEQHYKSLRRLFEPLGMEVCLLTGSMTAAARREACRRIESGEVQLVIGTHALISQGVAFHDLALVITDEQHRFGVAQRAMLANKTENPHILVMSATPIPRTLALIIYGDLDVSVIDELPPGRQKIETYAVGEKMRQRIYNFIRKQLDGGHQVYVVCPMVEENEDLPGQLKSAVEYTEELRRDVFTELPPESIGLVHGKMKPKEKDAVMSAFYSGTVKILVATTVIEVGVDVPNVTLIVVENADRFGLSQLHQLRGRVGRGKFQSYCVLFEGAGGEVARKRLKIMCETNDGFKIAEEDLRLRGPGDFIGQRQHGFIEMRIGNLASDMDILQEAQRAAGAVLEADPELATPENRSLRARIDQLIESTVNCLN